MNQYQQPQQSGRSAQQTGAPSQVGGGQPTGGQQSVGSGSQQATGAQQSAAGTRQQGVASGQQGGQQQLGQQAGGQQQGQTGLTFPTSSTVPETVRAEVIQQLNRTLADTTILMTHARFAHWNVKGMSFYGLHELFEDIGEMFEDHADLVAERITALGGQAMGTAGLAVSNCGIPQMPTTIVTGQEYVQVLAERLAVHDANLTYAIEAATEVNDLDTADLLNEISREVSEALWFLEAHLQTQPVSMGGGQQGGQQVGGQQPGAQQQVGGTQQGPVQSQR